MLIVQICDFGEDGDARYRVHDPSIALGALQSVSVIDCHFFSRELPALVEQADVLILQFVMDWELTGVCLRRRAAGKITVFEANDYFFDIQPWNPIAKHWQDYNVQELYLKLLSLCDGVQTTTDVLADRWRQLGAKNVVVFPNQLTRMNPLPAPEPRPLTIGWAGSPAHLADLYNIAPQLQRWLNDNPDVHLAIMTADTARPFFNLPPERYHFESFASLEAYLAFLRRIDIGLAPLLPTEYNRCRSDVKFLEYASQGVVGIYADLEPYRDVKNGQTGFVAGSTTEIIAHLDQLCSDPAIRLQVRQRAYQQVQDRMLPKHIQERLDWYRGMVGQTSSRGSGYARQLPDDSATILRNVTAQPAAQGSPALAGLLQKHPSYLAALQHQGRMLNDLRRGKDALAILQKAQALLPASARTLSEMGRSYYWLNDNAKAVETLNQAIAINPHYLPAWQYLLRMLDITKDESLAQRSAEATEYFPGCYPLAILGAHNAKSLLATLNDVAPRLTDRNRPTALAAFRPALLARPDVNLLRRACEVFPQSPLLSGALAEALERAGLHTEARNFFSRALFLQQQAEIATAELGTAGTPLKWQLADHIRRADLPTDQIAAGDLHCD